MIPEPGGSSLVVTDVRLANLARMTHELLQADVLSRTELARRSGVSVATAHRLIADLLALGLVQREPPAEGAARLGRPPVVYRFRDDAAVLGGVDVGNETTRMAITTLSGRVLAEESMDSSTLGRSLARTLAGRLAELIGQVRTVSGHQLAAAGVGVAAAVDEDGVLRAPPLHRSWAGLPLRADLSALLRCPVAVAQDDHLSPMAESSERGTFPGASSLLVLELGRGIGVGMTVQGVPLSGARYRFGRIADWPVAGAGPGPGRLPGRTIGECLAARGLVGQYLAAGGSPEVQDGAALATAARCGDVLAAAVFRWAAREVGDVVGRLQLLCDPEAIVIGGGLSRAYDLLEPGISDALPPGVTVAPSILGEQAVVTGAVLAARSLSQSWLNGQFARVVIREELT